MSRVYLVQHAQAKSQSEDPARPLTEKGWEDARRVASRSAEQAGIQVARIIHSGKLRAQQTASVWQGCLPDAQVVQADDLGPTADPAVWADRLQRQNDDLIIVGHLPHLGRLASRLLCGDDEQDVVTFENAGVVCLEKNTRGHWSLRWALVPSLL